jgi:hypothetical protein
MTRLLRVCKKLVRNCLATKGSPRAFRFTFPSPMPRVGEIPSLENAVGSAVNQVIGSDGISQAVATPFVKPP